MTAVEEIAGCEHVSKASFTQRCIRRIFPAKPVPENRPAAPSFWSNPLAWLLFSNSFRVVRTSISRQLEIQDITTLSENDASNNKAKEVQFYFNYYKKNNSKVSLFRALEKCYRKEILATGLCAAHSDLGYMCSALLLTPLVTYLTHRNEKDEGWQYTFGAGVGLIALNFLLIISIGLAKTHKINTSTFVGASMKTSLDSILLQKSFNISPLARKNTHDASEKLGWTLGEIYNIMNTDSERVFNASRNIHSVWTSFLSIPLAIGISYWLIGWAGVAGLASIIAFIPLVWLGAKVIAKTRRAANELADKRNGLVGDAIRNIRFLKCFVWEDIFFQRAANVREKEIKQNYKLAAINAILICINCAAYRIPPLLGVLLLSYYGDGLDASRVVPYYVLCYIIEYTCFEFSPALNDGINAFISIQRIQAFLLAEEIQDLRTYDPNFENAVTLEKTRLIWDREDDNVEIPLEERRFRLEPLNVEIKPSELIAIVGPSGSGKSSFVSGITGDMPCIGGEIKLKSSVAYCPQRPWIQSATVKDNILFGIPFEKEKYDGILYDCALIPDLKALANGDESQLGELGINLSGGQKQRVQLARTLYMDRDIVVMDDPLAAVDAATGRHLFENVICGRLKDKCRILVTHQLQVLNRVDRIIFMENGKIVALDTFENLMKLESFARFLMECQQQDEKDTSIEYTEEIEDADNEGEICENYELLLEEERAVSSVSTKTYLDFSRQGGSWTVVAIMYGVCLISQAFNVLVGIAFAWWSDNRWDLSNVANMGITLGMMFGHLITFTAFLIFVLVFCLRGSKKLSMMALERIMNAPIGFFDRTPLGRIINRFTVDVNQLDSELPFSIWLFALEGTSNMAAVVLVIVYVHVAAALVVPWVLVSIVIIYLYKASPREIKRLEALSNSRVSARLSEGRSGKYSIRSAGQDGLFLQRLHADMDDLNSIRREFYGAVQWAAIRQNVIASLFYLFIGILGLSVADNIAPSLFATFMAYASFLPINMGYITEGVTQVQRNMISVERLQYYAESIESEGVKRITIFEKGKNEWPKEGSIKFDGVDMRYDDGLPLTLHNVNLNIRGRSKVGIVGRTGAGKSSLFQVLLRMVKICEGNIFIDGMDITTQTGLHDLREKIAVIPQDPTLFEGTIRSNLDPMGEKDDYELNTALKNASLLDDEKDSNEMFNLDSKITAGGENLSNGQRQLMALARALVKDSKIIISDEATSSIDYETDAKIQRVMMGLENKTVISIAHRIRTILEYDYICVMDKGEVVEYDTPLNLFDNPESIFRSMCEESRLSREDIERK